ncbi:hypothetical protein [Limnoglobus roseus]|uniref:SMI1/KNR4 family protein n=1 Tax=Limnoglobus roseus TaxID=2598579 RepID=A0A5C1AIY8_9BACT|nr:hypothetical protein [Limnoglobus roseus]QEL16938.1 hypothetical protein PX52LOC_03914 [Limnoglobus roseus]
MSWYLTIRGGPDYSRFAATAPLVEFLAAMPELRQTGPRDFQAADGQPWVVVIMAACNPAGGYAIDGEFLPRINVVELVCSDSGDPAWYDALAGRIAEFLEWSAFEGERQAWPSLMTEAEWAAATEPKLMLEWRHSRETASERKLRLFAAAAFGRLLRLLPDPRQRRGVEVLEQVAEGVVLRSACRGVTAEVRQAIPREDRASDTLSGDDPHYIALMLYREFCSSSMAIHAVHATAGLADGGNEQQAQSQLLRCVFNPFAPTFDPRWLTATARSLAESAYEARAWDRLPILADALEDAGCEDEAVLSHLRGPGPHARGCWVLDLVLGKS